MLHYINEIEKAYPPLLNYQYDSPKKFFSGFIRTNPNTKLTLPLKMLGLQVLLDEVGVREFREMTKHYGSSAWYSINKEMKNLAQTDEPSVFSLLKKQITEFEPLKLLAIQDQMLNNVKYSQYDRRKILHHRGSSRNAKGGLSHGLSLDTGR